MGDIDKEVGYEHGRTEFGDSPAVLVVDLQLGFTDPRYPLGRLPMVDSATNSTAQLLRLARLRGVPVARCYTAHHSERDMPRWKVRPVHEHFFMATKASRPMREYMTLPTISRSARTRRRCSSTLR